jgi:two-component system, NtrC family, sensor histidine kinase HydH
MMDVQRFAMKRARFLSVGIALVSFAALSAVNVIIFRGMTERNRLESRNDSERTFSILFASLRRYDDFGSAIEATPSLEREILGVGLYGEGGGMLYRWGVVPESYVPPVFVDADVKNDMARMYLENAKNDSLILLLRPSGDGPPPPPNDEKGNGSRRSQFLMFDILRKADVIYLEIRQPQFWRQAHLQAVLFPTVEIILAAFVVFVRFLIIKNSEYRERIEQQKNLVILGTAASTLAHEIKNPLLAIRLQTSIIARTVPGGARRELSIIDSEVERLSMLSHRVNDFLRDPAGIPARIDPVEIASEVGERLCGRPIVHTPSGRDLAVKIDPERLRSILENLLRNALESGGREEDVEIHVGISDNTVCIDVLDRGRGISREHRERVFDPFFTTKSRGSGIGLAICRRFVQAAGGSIALEDRLHGGTRARIVLPGAGT